MEKLKDPRVKHAIGTVEALFSRTLDFGLWIVAYLDTIHKGRRKTYREWKRAVGEDSLLSSLEYPLIKRMIAEARRRDYVAQSVRGLSAWPELTAEGKKRLSAALFWQGNRKIPYDGRVYLVAYDVPETRHNQRDKLRTFVRGIGCVKLMDSLWARVSDPGDEIRAFMRAERIFGSLIVSSVDAGQKMGENSVAEELLKLYDIKKLNEMYSTWLKSVHSIPDHIDLLEYLFIFKDDPQLPRELLPKGFLGVKAGEIVTPILQKILT